LSSSPCDFSPSEELPFDEVLGEILIESDRFVLLIRSKPFSVASVYPSSKIFSKESFKLRSKSLLILEFLEVFSCFSSDVKEEFKLSFNLLSPRILVYMLKSSPNTALSSSCLIASLPISSTVGNTFCKAFNTSQL